MTGPLGLIGGRRDPPDPGQAVEVAIEAVDVRYALSLHVHEDQGIGEVYVLAGEQVQQDCPQAISYQVRTPAGPRWAPVLGLFVQELPAGYNPPAGFQPDPVWRIVPRGERICFIETGRARAQSGRWACAAALLLLALDASACTPGTGSSAARAAVNTAIAAATATADSRPLPTATATKVPAPTATPKPTATPYPITTAGISETIQVGDLQMVVGDLQFPPGTGSSGPAQGNVFIAFTMQITNTGSLAVTITPSQQMILKDSTAQIYKYSVKATQAITGTLPDLTLAPGETIKAQIGYEIPQAASGLQFTFAADRFGAGKVFVNLP